VGCICSSLRTSFQWIGFQPLRGARNREGCLLSSDLALKCTASFTSTPPIPHQTFAAAHTPLHTGAWADARHAAAQVHARQPGQVRRTRVLHSAVAAALGLPEPASRGWSSDTAPQSPKAWWLGNRCRCDHTQCGVVTSNGQQKPKRAAAEEGT